MENILAPNLKELYWAVGFIEGEGTFNHTNGRSGLHIKVAQNEIDPLERLQKVFGGKIYREHRKYKGKPRDIWCWAIYSSNAAAVMMTIYSLMSVRRKARIKEILWTWKYVLSKRNPYYWKRNWKKQLPMIIPQPQVPMVI